MKKVSRVPKRIFAAWLILNLSAFVVFVFITGWEISIRNFPRNDPFIIMRPLNLFHDVFLPVIKFTCLNFGFVTGLLFFLITLTIFMRSTIVKQIIQISCILLTIGLFWADIYWAYFMVDCSWSSIMFGDFCNPPQVKLSHLAIALFWTIGNVILWGKWRPKTGR